MLVGHGLRYEVWTAAQYARSWPLERPPPATATVLFATSEKLPTGKRLLARLDVAVYLGADAAVLGHWIGARYSL